MIPKPFGGIYAGKRVLVTGHTGFKGSWLTAWLLELGAVVCGLSLDIPTEPSAFKAAALEQYIDHHFMDVRDLNALRGVLLDFKPDFVFYLAAQALVSRSYDDPLSTITTNVIGTANFLESLREVDWSCTAIIITSDKCYENVEWPWGYRENDHLGGKDIYSGSKGAAEVIFHAFQKSFFSAHNTFVRLATARAGNVIGGGDWAADRIIADCIRAWTTGRPVEIRSPMATRPWQHVLEPLSGYLRLGEVLVQRTELNGEQFNFGPRAEQNRTVVEVISDLARFWEFGADSAPYRVTDNIPFHEAGLLKLNCDKALLLLRWEPTLVYDECIHMTGHWYRNFYKNGAEGAYRLMVDQLHDYQNLAVERHRAWSVS